ncbi:MAG: hypothetical protein [Siphoviridae sp. ctpQM7]|nr:MAG: hypothetical protein [Siphoviridae sp. ctpQM7]
MACRCEWLTFSSETRRIENRSPFLGLQTW